MTCETEEYRSTLRALFYRVTIELDDDDDDAPGGGGRGRRGSNARGAHANRRLREVRHGVSPQD